jgi:hypothetical protein
MPRDVRAAKRQERKRTVLECLARTREVTHPEGVMPLNAGFFHLERARKAAVGKAKARTAVRKSPEAT